MRKAQLAVIGGFVLSGAVIATPAQAGRPDGTAARPATAATAPVVVRHVPGDDAATWVVPRGAPMPTVTSRPGRVRIVVTARPSAAWTGRGVPGSVSWQAPSCRSRWDETVGWFDTCGQFGQVVGTGDRRRHWVYRQYGTCRSHDGFRLLACRVSTDRNRTGPRLRWDDWSPRGDSTGGCRDVALNLSVLGVGVGGSFAACETIDVRKFSRPGHFAVTWRGWALRTDREVAGQIAFSAPRHRIPVLSASWRLTGVVAR
ncbi:MAG: hypothetical protein U0R64_04470 [Candidatus Nanopelagicales bacterium]